MYEDELVNPSGASVLNYNIEYEIYIDYCIELSIVYIIYYCCHMLYELLYRLYMSLYSITGYYVYHSFIVAFQLSVT